LQNHLKRIARHPVLRDSKVFRDFLKETVPPIHRQKQETRLLDSLSDTFINVFTKVKKPNEKFEEIGDILDKFEQSITSIEKSHDRLLKLQKGFYIY
jgi:sorting nexin-4